jgi:pimeloyl-ACP methyl ester carboxylesterase
MRISDRRRSSLLLSGDFGRSTPAESEYAGRFQDVVCLGSGDPLVLVPGLAGGTRLVMPFARHLAKRFRIFIPAIRGDDNPLSTHRPREIADLSADLQLTLESLGLERPTLLGISFGAAIALEFAAENPGHVGAMGVYGGLGRFEASLGSTIARRVFERFPLPKDNGFVNQFFNLLHGGKPEAGPLAEFIVDRCWETDQAVIAQRLGLLERFDVSDRLWRIDAPTFVAAGSRDVIARPSEQRELASSIPGASFHLLEGAGHVGFLTHRKELASAFSRFVRTQARSAC